MTAVISLSKWPFIRLNGGVVDVSTNAVDIGDKESFGKGGDLSLIGFCRI